MTSEVHFTLEQVHSLTSEILVKHGVSAEQARAVADTVTAAERDGCKSHGLFRVPGYLKSVVSGKVSVTATPIVSELSPAVVRVDGGGCFAPLALEAARAPLVAAARKHGVAIASIADTYHFAALWPEVEALAEEGLVAFAFVNSFAYVAPAGGREKLYGTNPMAFAWPRRGRPPLVFDQASSASARGEILLHQRDGHPLPDGWAIGPDGEPTNDPATALAGAQLPFGGYKGAALALMVELLAGALIGQVHSYEATANDNKDGGPPRGGELLIAIDPTACIPGADEGAQAAHAEQLFAKVLEQDGTRLPSDRRFAARKVTGTEGITIPASLAETLEQIKS